MTSCTCPILYSKSKMILPASASLARPSKMYIGLDVLTDCQPWMASETFALTARLYPGVLIFTGIENKEKGCGANHHTPEFDLDEDGLPYGAATCLGFALDYLKRKAGYSLQTA